MTEWNAKIQQGLDALNWLKSHIPDCPETVVFHSQDVPHFVSTLKSSWNPRSYRLQVGTKTYSYALEGDPLEIHSILYAVGLAHSGQNEALDELTELALETLFKGEGNVKILRWIVSVHKCLKRPSLVWILCLDLLATFDLKSAHSYVHLAQTIWPEVLQVDLTHPMAPSSVISRLLSHDSCLFEIVSDQVLTLKFTQILNLELAAITRPLDWSHSYTLLQKLWKRLPHASSSETLSILLYIKTLAKNLVSSNAPCIEWLQSVLVDLFPLYEQGA